MEKSGKILVVDDETSIRFLLSDILSNKGFEVTEAKDGQESLEKMEQSHFDLVITDICMPRLDGIAMLDRMEKAGRKEKVIIMTGNPSEQTHSYEKMPRVITLLHKPFRIDNLIQIVTDATNSTAYPPGFENRIQH